jgi:hypothetical protein
MDKGAEFCEVLLALDEGAVHGDVSAEMRDLVVKLTRFAEENGKAAGTLALTLKVKCDRGGTLDVSAEIKSKAPTRVRPRTVLWANKAGAVLTANPKQLPLGLGARAVGRAPAREVETDKDEDETEEETSHEH